MLAVHTSVVEPLPHQITAVYESMLPRQPLRFLLADDPGAGKTIMAGLLIKELIARGDLQRCLVVCPGSLAEQWQDELYRRFQLPFDILTNDKLEAARTGNWFLETNLVIARLDKLSRNEDVQQKLQVPDCRWDLVVCDEGGTARRLRRSSMAEAVPDLDLSPSRHPRSFGLARWYVVACHAESGPTTSSVSGRLARVRLQVRLPLHCSRSAIHNLMSAWRVTPRCRA